MVVLPAQFGTAGSENSNIYSNYLDEGWRGGRSCIHIHTHILHLSCGAAQRGSRGVWVNAAKQHADRPVFKVQLIIFSVYHHITRPNTSVVLRLYNMRSGEEKRAAGGVLLSEYADQKVEHM